MAHQMQILKDESICLYFIAGIDTVMEQGVLRSQ